MEPAGQNTRKTHFDNPSRDLEKQGSEIEIIESAENEIDNTVEKSTLDSSIISENVSKHGEKRYQFYVSIILVQVNNEYCIRYRKQLSEKSRNANR